MTWSIYDLNNCFEWQITKNKTACLDIIIDKNWTEYFEFRVRLDRKVDHAGFEFNLSILGFESSFYIRDMRHWNDEEARWALPDDFSADDMNWSNGLNDDN